VVKRRIRTPLQGGARPDDGFTLAEAVIAMLLLSLVIIGAEWGVIGTLSAASLNKQHSVATGLVASTISELEALPFSELEQGLDPSWDYSHGASLAGDSNVTVSGGTYHLNIDNKATILTSQSCSSSCTDAPLVPHVSSVVVGGMTYKVSVYPTATSTSGLVNVVVVVSWVPPDGGSARVVGDVQVAKP
jgi:hypothetical protein